MRCKNCLTEIDGAVCPNCGSPASELSEIEQNEIDEIEEAFWRSIRESVDEQEAASEEKNEAADLSRESVESEKEEPVESLEEQEEEMAEPSGAPEGQASEALRGIEEAEDADEIFDIDFDDLEAAVEKTEAAEQSLRMKPNRYDLLELELSREAQEQPSHTEPEAKEEEKKEDFRKWKRKRRDSHGKNSVKGQNRDSKKPDKKKKSGQAMSNLEKISHPNPIVIWLLVVEMLVCLALMIFAGYAIVRAIQGNPLSGQRYPAKSAVAYVKEDDTLWMSKNGKLSSRKLADNVDCLIDCNVASETYLYMDNDGNLCCLVGENRYCLGAGMSSYDIYREESLSAVSYVVYDEVEATYDAYVWVKGMEEAKQIEYSVPYVEHFRYSSDGSILVYSVQNMTGSHMIKRLELDTFERVSQNGGSAEVYLASNDYLTCYDVWGGSGSHVLYYDYEKGAMCIYDGTVTSTIAENVQNAFVLKENRLLITLQKDGSVTGYDYRKTSGTEAVKLYARMGAFDKLELISDAHENPQLLIMWQSETGYGVPVKDIAASTGEDSAQKLFDGAVFQIKTDGEYVTYLQDGRLMSRVLGAGDGAEEPVVEAENVSAYELSDYGRIYWKDSETGMLVGRLLGNKGQTRYMGGVSYYQIVGDDMYFRLSNGKLFGYYNGRGMLLIDEEVSDDCVVGNPM